MSNLEFARAQARDTKIKLHGPDAFAGMHKAGQLVAEALDLLVDEVKPGVTTEALDALVFDFAMDHGAVPAPLNYRGFPKSICTSLNHVVFKCRSVSPPRAISVVHSIPVGCLLSFLAEGRSLGSNQNQDNAMNPKTTALVLIEYQNEFVSPGGIFHDAVKGVMESSSMLANTLEVANKARQAGITIIHAPISFTDDFHELTPTPYGILKAIVDNKAFRKGSWGAEIVESLKPKSKDIVIEGKRGLCAFQSTNLDFILRSKGIQTVALAGFLTNCCVESTMRSAYERGFDVITLKDCTAATSQKEQAAAIEFDFGMFSRPMNHDEFVDQLSAVSA